jgi:predicted ribosomally synthesized peptide with SipW-like signal peptide
MPHGVLSSPLHCFVQQEIHSEFTPKGLIMKNSALIKGTAAIAVGAALLLGGGGTLASWNAADAGTPGTVIAGDLNVTAATGAWTDRTGHRDRQHRQLQGCPRRQADLHPEPERHPHRQQDGRRHHRDGHRRGGRVHRRERCRHRPGPDQRSPSAVVSNPLTTSGTVTATITFEFKSATSGRSDVTKTYNFGNVAFALNQVTQTGLS